MPLLAWPCAVTRCVPPSQAKPSALPRPGANLGQPSRDRMGGHLARTYTPGTCCSISFCISAAFQERLVQVLPKYSRPIPELSGGASFPNSKADNSITTSTRLCTALSSGQPYPSISEDQMFPLSTAPPSYLPF